MTPRRADGLLLAATLIWGLSFVVIKQTLTYITPLAFVALRFGTATVLVAPFARLTRPFTRAELAGGALLALQAGIGFLALSVGLVTTTPSRSAFIVALSSVLAPMMAAAALRERPRWSLAAALVVATVGLYYLAAPEAGGVNRGDLWTLVTAVLFGGQIVTVAVLSRRFDVWRLVWMQLAGTALLAGIGTALLEQPRVQWTTAFVLGLAYATVFPTIVALALQLYAQRYMSSARAALIFCLESLCAAATSWLILGERLSALQWMGGGLILTGMVLAELGVVSHPPSVVNGPEGR
ncbi:MAG TPA: DMT family transporter [Gemmatimonadales bacterium]